MADLSYDGIEMNREYGPWEYPWRERIERYLEAVQNAFAWHREKSPWGPPVAPPTIMGNATLRFIDSIAPVPPGTLHVKQELEIGNALRRDRELVGYGQFVDKYERRGRRWFVFSTRWRDGSGLVVGRSKVTMAFPDRIETEEEAKERRDEKGRKADLTLAARTLTQEKMTAYSEDSANALRGQSIHTAAAIAKAKGYANSVAQGLMSADYVSELMTGEMKQGWLLHGRLSLAFVRPVLCGDTVTAQAALREVLDEGAYSRRVYDVRCENQEGEAVTAGTASGLVAAG
jgi:acyl dehydratase